MLELYVYTEMADGPDTEADVTFVPVAPAGQEAGVRRAWARFDAAQCQAFDPADKETIMAVIAASEGGIKGFNVQVQKLADTFCWTESPINSNCGESDDAWPDSPTSRGTGRGYEEIPLRTDESAGVGRFTNASCFSE